MRPCGYKVSSEFSLYADAVRPEIDRRGLNVFIIDDKPQQNAILILLIGVIKGHRFLSFSHNVFKSSPAEESKFVCNCEGVKGIELNRKCVKTGISRCGFFFPQNVI